MIRPALVILAVALALSGLPMGWAAADVRRASRRGRR